MSNLTFLFCAVCYSQYIIYLRTYFPCAGSDDAGHAPETGGDGAGHGSSDMDYTCSGEWVVLGGITYCLPPNIADLFRSWGIPMGEPNSVADLRAVFGKIWQNRMLDRPPPPGSWRPFLGEILDPPLKFTFFCLVLLIPS